MTRKRAHSSDRTKMFHSIVLMGSGLAIGCGGVARIDASGGAAGSVSASPGGASTGGASAGGAPGIAGTGSIISVGGTLSFAGAIGVGGVLNVAGSGATGGTIAGFINPLPCSPSQWSCADLDGNCEFGYGVTPGADCQCDSTRPAQASDCKPGQSFVCLQVSQNALGQPITPVVPFECSCQPTAVDCGTACDYAFPNASIGCYLDEANAIQCGCVAPVVLK